MRFSQGGNPYEYSLVPERTIEKISEKIAAGDLSSSADFLEEIDRESIIVCRCTECGRLYLEENQKKPGTYYLYERPE